MNHNERHCLGNLLMYMDMCIWELSGIELNEDAKRAKEGIVKNYPEFADDSMRKQIIAEYLDELFVKEA